MKHLTDYSRESGTMITGNGHVPAIYIYLKKEATNAQQVCHTLSIFQQKSVTSSDDVIHPTFQEYFLAFQRWALVP
ncbi:hypothetical protein [Elizabethkingia meningoseptica]|uniref:hypothetical protein n=1 Tax=Elizabethkingia meningoseptica TaxID=238 RepID=UPI001366154E|nr:hypothetical protein [Elizabethkingia meningoseptica]MDE5489590.1 hypothetical protein [Elizabethkingia meningoseptica]MVW91544.1 hypothetical protein [Elizabethkingia meningoseptica]